MSPIMGLPEAIQQAIEKQTAAMPAQMLAAAAAELGRDYHEATPRISSPQARAAYVATRMPAIFQVNQLVCAELARLCPALEIRSVLDLGCGPGSATLAVRQTFAQLQAATLADRDSQWFETARNLVAALDPKLAGASRFVTRDLENAEHLDEHDLVVVSYALGEMAPSRAKDLLERAWISARSAIVIVEPGTPRGFNTIVAAREALIAAGSNIIAPCTHAGRCPLVDKDWCHFDTRVERTRRHQQAKSGTLPYEIEKFSYVIAAGEPGIMPRTAARIIRRPLKKSGHVILDLCTSAGDAKRVVVSRRHKESYRQARAAKWGGLWNFP
jgi:ribosomal protein RSM22 (predicted rRNA methylase)